MILRCCQGGLITLTDWFTSAGLPLPPQVLTLQGFYVLLNSCCLCWSGARGRLYKTLPGKTVLSISLITAIDFITAIKREPLRTITDLIIMKSNLRAEGNLICIQMVINLHRTKPKPWSVDYKQLKSSGSSQIYWIKSAVCACGTCVMPNSHIFGVSRCLHYALKNLVLQKIIINKYIFVLLLRLAC